MEKRLPCRVSAVPNLNSAEYDSILFVSPSHNQLHGAPETLSSAIAAIAKIDKNVEEEGVVVPVNLPAQRLVFSPTGSVTGDYDDVRKYSEAAYRGIKRAINAGSKSPLLILPKSDRFSHVEVVTLLGALEGLYVPIQYREDIPEKAQKIQKLGVWTADQTKLQSIIKLATAIESGRFVARDIGGGDPERMAAPNVEKYVREVFAGTNIKLDVISDEAVLLKEYPLFAAVNRAASVIERHKGRIIFLEYQGEGPITQTLMPVGKGITYDTGGADIKAGGVMAGMSRDKCGAAAVAGFFQILAALQPKGVKVIGALCLARNSVGENCYVADEMITARSKQRVRVGNTDAEGRMVMGDVLCRMKELAVNEVNPHLMTIATLTGHAVLAVGHGYSIVIDNGVARKEGNSKKLQVAGDTIGDLFEVSTMKREDIAFHKGKCEGEDVYQCNNSPSSRTPRGHQGPAGFLLLASGLDKHGSDSEKPLKYSHLDIAGSAGDVPDPPTGAPIAALTISYLEGSF